MIAERCCLSSVKFFCQMLAEDDILPKSSEAALAL